MLGIKENKHFTNCLLHLIYISGCEMNKFKSKVLPKLNESYPGFREYVQKLFGGYYTDL